MAGRGPAPKDRGQRVGRHRPARGEWVDLEPLACPVLPELPERVDGEWSEGARAVWGAWRADPVTVLWGPADVAYALDTIRLYEGMSASSAGEVRLRMDGLGLTPKGKKDLRWRLPSERAAVEGSPAGGSAPVVDIRKRLRAV